MSAHRAPGREQSHQLVAVRQLLDDDPALLEARGLHVVDALGVAGAADMAGLYGISGVGRSEATLAKIVRSRL